MSIELPYLPLGTGEGACFCVQRNRVTHKQTWRKAAQSPDVGSVRYPIAMSMHNRVEERCLLALFHWPTCLRWFLFLSILFLLLFWYSFSGPEESGERELSSCVIFLTFLVWPCWSHSAPDLMRLEIEPNRHKT